MELPKLAGKKLDLPLLGDEFTLTLVLDKNSYNTVTNFDPITTTMINLISTPSQNNSTHQPTRSPQAATDNVPQLREHFWQRFALDELTTAEWEALCDGCGACCLVKFLDDYEDQTEVEYTDVACQLLDCKTGYCSDYAHRQQFVPDCVALTVDKLPEMMWLPRNCAYKRLYLGQDLPKWHLLITKDAVATQHGMRAAGVGVAGRCISELGVDEEELEDRIVRWVKV